jgi:saccharopine dehydrogenase (NAD+, L-lysine-forming)
MITEPSLAFVDGAHVEEAVGKESRRFPFPAEFGDHAAYSAPLGDLATAPRTTGAKTVRTFVSLAPIAGVGAKIASPIARALFKGVVRDLAESALPATGAGPEPDERMKNRFAFMAEAIKGSRVSRAMITGSDGYGITAHTAVHAALALCNPAYTRFGALSPMQAIEPGIWRLLLEKLGCQITMLKMENIDAHAR